MVLEEGMNDHTADLLTVMLTMGIDCSLCIVVHAAVFRSIKKEKTNGNTRSLGQRNITGSLFLGLIQIVNDYTSFL